MNWFLSVLVCLFAEGAVVADAATVATDSYSTYGPVTVSKDGHVYLKTIVESAGRSIHSRPSRILMQVDGRAAFYMPQAVGNAHFSAIPKHTSGLMILQTAKPSRGQLPVFACVLVAGFMIFRRRKHLRS